MLLIVLSVVVALGATGFAILHLRAMSSALRAETAPLVIRLKRMPTGDRLAALLEAVPSASWEGQIGEALSTSASPELKAAAANESLGDLGLVFTSRGRWAPSAIRIALLAGLLFGALSLIQGAHLQAILVVAVCAVGALVCAVMSSKASETEKAQRKIADDLVEVLLPGVPRTETVGRRFRNAW